MAILTGAGEKSFPVGANLKDMENLRKRMDSEHKLEQIQRILRYGSQLLRL
jgi:enoyl-CoA hydratase/carnithine racemase